MVRKAYASQGTWTSNTAYLDVNQYGVQVYFSLSSCKQQVPFIVFLSFGGNPWVWLVVYRQLTACKHLTAHNIVTRAKCRYANPGNAPWTLQIWTVPATGAYSIALAGASGGTTRYNRGGAGARFSIASLELLQNSQLYMVVGQYGGGMSHISDSGI